MPTTQTQTIETARTNMKAWFDDQLALVDTGLWPGSVIYWLDAIFMQGSPESAPLDVVGFLARVLAYRRTNAQDWNPSESQLSLPSQDGLTVASYLAYQLPTPSTTVVLPDAKSWFDARLDQVADQDWNNAPNTLAWAHQLSDPSPILTPPPIVVSWMAGVLFTDNPAESDPLGQILVNF